MAAFADMGEEIEGVSVIGESGLLAASESAKLGGMIDVEEEAGEEQEETEQTGEKDAKGRGGGRAPSDLHPLGYED